jgi:hypothetical protein
MAAQPAKKTAENRRAYKYLDIERMLLENIVAGAGYNLMHSSAGWQQDGERSAEFIPRVVAILVKHAELIPRSALSRNHWKVEFQKNAPTF